MGFNSLTTLRGLLSILLLGLFGLPLVSPLFALGHTPESRLPACCRKGGDHHCMGSMSQQDMNDSHISPNPTFSHLAARCPYAPAAISLHTGLILTQSISACLAPQLAHPILAARNASMRRIAQDRSRPKRGPPQVA